VPYRPRVLDDELDLLVSGLPAPRSAKQLNWLESEIGETLIDKVVVTAGESAYRMPDGTAVVPLALLGP
jgi:hypothetical protein